MRELKPKEGEGERNSLRAFLALIMYKLLDIDFLINPDINPRILYPFCIKRKESSTILRDLPKLHSW